MQTRPGLINSTEYNQCSKLNWLMFCHSQCIIGQRSFVSICFYVVLLFPSFSGCTWNLPSTISSPDLSSRYFLPSPLLDNIQLCDPVFTISSTLISAVLTRLTDWVCHIGTLTLCIEARGGCLELYYCNMVEWFWWDSSLISTTNWFPSVLWYC